MITMELPLVIWLLIGVSRAKAQYDPGPFQFEIPARLTSEENFATAINFDELLPSAAPKQYIATVLSSNEAISMALPAHSQADSQPTDDGSASTGKHHGDYKAILHRQQFASAIPYPANVAQGHSHLGQRPQSLEKARHVTHTLHAAAVPNDGVIQMPKERVSVSSFPSMQAAKTTFGEQIKLDNPSKFRKELDKVEWREEIVFPRPGPTRIRWNPKSYTEDERIVRARNNRFVYAEFRDGSEADDALEQTGRKIPPKVKPSLNLRTTHAATLYDPARGRSRHTAHGPEAEQDQPQDKVVYEQQPFRVKEEEQLRSQFGYTGKAQTTPQDHEVRYYPKKPSIGKEEPSAEVDYERPLRHSELSQTKSLRKPQFQVPSTHVSDEEPRNVGQTDVIEYNGNGYDAPKIKNFPRYQTEDVESHGVRHAAYDDAGSSDSSPPAPPDAHVYRQGRQNRPLPHPPREDESEHDDRLVYRRKVPKYVTQDNISPSQEDLEDYPPRQSDQRQFHRKRNQQKHEYRPEYESDEAPAGHVRAYDTRSEYSSRYAKLPKQSEKIKVLTKVNGSPRKHVSIHDAGEAAEIPVRYGRKKKRVYYDDEDDEDEEAPRRRVNIRFENNPGEQFSFRKENRKGESAEEPRDVDDAEDNYDDRLSIYPRSLIRGLRVGPEPGEGGVNLSFKLA